MVCNAVLLTTLISMVYWTLRRLQ